MLWGIIRQESPNVCQIEFLPLLRSSSCPSTSVQWIVLDDHRSVMFCSWLHTWNCNINAWLSFLFPILGSVFLSVWETQFRGNKKWIFMFWTWITTIPVDSTVSLNPPILCESPQNQGRSILQLSPQIFHPMTFLQCPPPPPLTELQNQFTNSSWGLSKVSSTKCTLSQLKWRMTIELLLIIQTVSFIHQNQNLHLHLWSPVPQVILPLKCILMTMLEGHSWNHPISQWLEITGQKSVSSIHVATLLRTHTLFLLMDEDNWRVGPKLASFLSPIEPTPSPEEPTVSGNTAYQEKTR